MRDEEGMTMEEYAEKQKKILDIKLNILKDAVKERDSAMVVAIAEIVKAIN